MCVSGSSSLAKAILFIFLLLITLIVPANATVINVDDDGFADYSSIQEAVNNASSGDTILVYQGTYVENVVIGEDGTFLVQNLTIKSQSGPDFTVVQAADTGDPVFHVTANNVTISGFNVTGGRGIDFSESLHSELSNNIISNGGIVALMSDITVINNTVISKGITLFECEGIFENNDVYSCSSTGISIESQSYCILVNNTIYDNNVGIMIQEFASGYIYNNIIYGNEKAGIEIGLTSYGRVANNTIYGNDEVGIRLTDIEPYGDIYNNYLNNTVNAQIDAFYPSDITHITWNITKTAGTNIVGGPFLGGNYWANPDGTGFSQVGEDLDGDGICDSPYIIDVRNTDYLPLYLPTPVEKTEDLKEYVDSLDGDVADSTKHVLNVKLDAVIKNFDKGDNDKAIKTLENFIKFVDIKERQGKLGSEQAQYLINEANSIIEMIQN